MNNNFEDLFKLFDVDNAWKELNENYFTNETIDGNKFFTLMKETHEIFIPIYEENSIPKHLLSILLYIQELVTDKSYINDEYETYKLIAQGFLNSIIANINDEQHKQGNFDVEINNKLINFNINNPNIKNILKEVSKVNFNS